MTGLIYCLVGYSSPTDGDGHVDMLSALEHPSRNSSLIRRNWSRYLIRIHRLDVARTRTDVPGSGGATKPLKELWAFSSRNFTVSSTSLR